jgi:heme exporter protein B
MKEWRSEWRTRVAISSVGLFALSSLTIIALALRGGGAPSREIAAALIWIVILFTSATGLGRSFAQEEDRGTALALRIAARSTAVWTGKFLANACLLLIIAFLASPLLLTMLGLSVANLPLFFAVLFLGNIGLAAVMTLTASLVAQTTSRTGLLAALSFPLLTPLLLSGAHGIEAALGIGKIHGSFSPGLGDLQVLFSYAVVSITASLMLFGFIWDT